MAAKHDVDRKTVRNIRQGLTYADVPDQPTVVPDFDPAFHNQYLVGDPLKLLGKVPAGCAQTVLTAPPPYRPVRVSDREHREHVVQQRCIIEECLRVVGAAGVVMYLHRPQFEKGGSVVDVGSGIFQNLPLRRVIIWNCPMLYERRTEFPRVERSRGPQNYANILVFAGENWQVPEDVQDCFVRWGAVWTFRRPHPTNAPPEFPLELARRCIALGQGPVLDAYAGTGTTALAAKDAGRDWILSDRVSKYRESFEWRRSGLGETDSSLRRVPGRAATAAAQHGGT